MSDKELHELTSWTPALTDITVFWWPSGWAEVKKSTFSSIKDLLKTSYDALYQAILVSGTNIKTLNGNTLLWSGDLSIPTLTDGDKGDITLSSSGTVWTIDNDVVTNAKMANVASATFKGRTTVGTGDPEDMTATQATALLNTATTSLKGLMSSTDKTKLDAIPSWVWTFVWVKCTTSATQTIYDNSLDYLDFNSEEFDTDTFHSISSNTSRITIPSWKDGKYQITWQVRVSTTNATDTHSVIIYKNWVSTNLSCQYVWTVTSWLSEAGHQVNWILDLAVGDYIQLWVVQRNWWSNSTTVAVWCIFSAYKIG